MTIASVAPSITVTGITIPTLSDIVAKIKADINAIHGSNALNYSDGDTAWVTGLATHINDINLSIVDAYNAFNVSLAQGTGLSSVVGINALTRGGAAPSTAVGTVTGVNGTTITNGQVKDAAGNIWTLPQTVVIGVSGTVTNVPIICQVPGAIAAGIGTITTIGTPVAGWTGFTNTSAAALGSLVESDAALRVRQTFATAAPSQGMALSIAAAINLVPGVTGLRLYENATNATDSNGVPAWNTCCLVKGGADIDVANAIDLVRPPAFLAYGGGSPVSVVIKGNAIVFARPTAATVAANITVKQIVNGAPITGGALSAATIAALQASVQAAINAVRPGLGVVSYFGMIPAASLSGTAYAGTYEVSAMTLNKNGGSFSAADVALTFLEMAVAGTVTVTVA